MRIHKLLATVLAAGLVFSGCHQDEDYLLPDIEINAESLDFSDDTELKISLTASRDWLVRSKPDWVAVDPDHGSASSNPQRVVISVLPNNDYNRTGEVLFTIGLDKAAVEVIQPGAKGEKPRGSGTLEDPYTVGGAVEYISGLAADAATTENVYIKGKISSINEEFSAQYGNGTFYITDDSGATFYVFRTMYLGNAKWTANDTQIKTGDEVVICGQVVNYKGNTPETVANKSYIYSLNGETRGSGGGNGTGTPSGTGTLADPYNAAGVNAYINTFADNAQSDKDVYVKGKISKIANNGEFGSYGNATFYITDDGSTSGEDFYCYRVLYLDKKDWKDGDTQIKVGDEVIICGKVTKYVSSYGTTPETVQKEAYIYSLNGTTGSGSSSGGEQGGSGTTPGNDGSGNEGGSQGGTQTEEKTLFSQAFKTDGQGNFTIEDKTLPEGLSYVWKYDDRYGMKASAYVSQKNYAAESWLISPLIDLTSATKPVLTFRHAMNYFSSVEKSKEEATLWVRIEGGEWTQLTITAYPAMDFKFVDSGEINLLNYIGKKIQIAFKYKSTEDKAGTWEVDDFKVINKAN